MIKKILTGLILLGSSVLAQTPQIPTSTPTPVTDLNAKYVSGIGLGYSITTNTGLTVRIGAGTSFCNSIKYSYAGSIITLVSSSINYIYLDSNCTLTTNTTGFSNYFSPIAEISTSSSAVTNIVDDRTLFNLTPPPATNFSSPPAIGNTTPNTGNFTTLTATTLSASSISTNTLTATTLTAPTLNSTTITTSSLSTSTLSATTLTATTGGSIKDLYVGIVGDLGHNIKLGSAVTPGVGYADFFNNGGITSIDLYGAGPSTNNSTFVVNFYNSIGGQFVTGLSVSPTYAAFSGQISALTGQFNNLSLTNALSVVNGGTGANNLSGYVFGNGVGALTASPTIPWSNITVPTGTISYSVFGRYDNITAQTGDYTCLQISGALCKTTFGGGSVLTGPQLNFSNKFTGSLAAGNIAIDLNSPGTGNYVATYNATPGTSTNCAVFDGSGNLVPATTNCTTNGYIPGGAVTASNITFISSGGGSGVYVEAISGTDSAHNVVLHTGSAPASGAAIYSFTFTTVKNHVPVCMVQYPWDPSGVTLATSIVTQTGYALSAAGGSIPASTVYGFTVLCM